MPHRYDPILLVLIDSFTTSTFSARTSFSPARRGLVRPTALPSAHLFSQPFTMAMAAGCSIKEPSNAVTREENMHNSPTRPVTVSGGRTSSWPQRATATALPNSRRLTMGPRYLKTLLVWCTQCKHRNNAASIGNGSHFRHIFCSQHTTPPPTLPYGGRLLGPKNAG